MTQEQELGLRFNRIKGWLDVQIYRNPVLLAAKGRCRLVRKVPNQALPAPAN